jgi:hypothetical protein
MGGQSGTRVARDMGSSRVEVRSEKGEGRREKGEARSFLALRSKF